MAAIVKEGRIELIDALRGFAIATILLLHSSNNFLYTPDVAPELPDWLLYIDSLIKSLLYGIFEGRVYSIFALLFGYTLAMQYGRGRCGEGEFRLRMVWRMVLLGLFGAFNGAFFAGGDPLVFYAIVMLPVIFMLGLSSRVLLVVAALLLLEPISIVDHYHNFVGESYLECYSAIAISVKEGEFLPMALANITTGLKGALLWAIETGRATQTFALFILGVLAFRVGLFGRSSREVGRYLVVALLSSALLYLAVALAPYPWHLMLYKAAFSAVLLLLFILLYRASSGGAFWRMLALYGRMSLTNFIAQSIICSFIYYPWGLNMASHSGVTTNIFIALVVLSLQILFSRFWLSTHSRGPLEALWHRMTWGGRFLTKK